MALPKKIFSSPRQLWNQLAGSAKRAFAKIRPTPVPVPVPETGQWISETSWDKLVIPNRAGKCSFYMSIDALPIAMQAYRLIAEKKGLSPQDFFLGYLLMGMDIAKADHMNFDISAKPRNCDDDEIVGAPLKPEKYTTAMTYENMLNRLNVHKKAPANFTYPARRR